MADLVHKAHLQLYGMFLAYQLNPDKPYWEDKFSQIREETGIYKITCFKYGWERNGLYNDFIPWKKITKKDVEDYPKKYKESDIGKYDLRNTKTGHSPAFKKFNKIANSQKCEISPWVYYPGMYAEQPFKNNINGIHSIWDSQPFIFRVFERDLNKSTKLIKKIYPDLSKLFYQWTNEVSNQGDWMFGYTIKNRHGFWYDTLKEISSKYELKNLFSDCSFSDFVYLNEPSYYCKYILNGEVVSKILNQEQYNEIKDSPNFIALLASGGKVEYDRTNIIELHGWYPDRWNEPIEQGSTTTWYESLKNNTWNLGLSTDGCTKGHGPKFCMGTWQGLNYDELYLFSKQCFTFPKSVRVLECPMECFEKIQYNGKWIAKENYDLLQLDRIKAIRQAWIDTH